MKIKYGIYTLEPENRAYNLFKTVEATKKETKEKYLMELNIGWSMKFETCVERIISDMLADIDTTVTLRGYIDEYRKMKEQLLSEVKF